MKTIGRTFLLVAVLAFAACSSGERTSSSSISAAPESCKEAFALLTKFTTVIERNYGDCALMGQALEPWIKAHQEELQRIRGASADNKYACKKFYKGRLAPLAQKINLAQKCTQDEKVKLALEAYSK